MAITVQLKYSDVPGRRPTLGNLVLGELGLNSYDGKLFAKKKQGAIEEIIEVGKVFIDVSAQEVLGVEDNTIFALEADSNKLVFWDYSQNKLNYLGIGDGLSISNNTLSSAGGTNLSYNENTRTVLSSTGTGATLPVATSLISGLLSSSDKNKLDSIEPGATANSTDAQLRDRATHTGTQSFSTISGLVSKSLLGRSSANSGPAENLTVGTGLDIVGGVLLNTIGATSLSAPLGFSVSGSGTSSISIEFSPGYSLPTTSSQSNWDTAYSERLRWSGSSSGLDPSVGRSSLGLGDSSTKNVGTVAGTVAAGDDSRITGALSIDAAAATYQPLDSDLTAIAALTTTTFGRSLLTQADQSAALTTLGAAPVSHNHSVSQITGLSNNVLLGRYSAGTGSAQTITLGSGLSLTPGGTLIATAGSGTVTSVGLSLPDLFSVTNSPVTTSGSLTATLNTQASNTVLAGHPTPGVTAIPYFRKLGYSELDGLPILGNSSSLNVGTVSGTVAAGDDSRFSTNISYSASTRTLSSSTGTGTTLPLASITLAGLQSATDKSKLDNLATVASTGSYSDLTGKPTLGSAAALNSGTSPGNVPVLDGSGKLTSTVLPSYVDDVIEASTFSALPVTGESGKIYVTLDTNKTYRWGGSSYVEISSSPGSTDSVPEGTVNLYFTAARASAAAPVQSVSGRTGAITLSVSDVSGALSTSAAALTYQPLDSDLTAIAALTTTTFGRSLLTQVDGPATRSAIGAGTGDGTVTGVSATGLLISSGGTAPQISSSIASNNLAGRYSAGTGALEAISLGAGLSIVGGALTVTSGGTGTVTSVGLSLPSIFTVSNSPVTSSGTLTATLAVQAANQVFAGPSFGSASSPGFRQLGYSELTGLPTLGTAAALNVGTTTGTVAAGDDSRLSDQRTPLDGSVTDAKITTAGLAASSLNGTSIQAWAPDTLYTKGDLVDYLGVAYRRISTGTSGSTFTSFNWNQTTSSSVISHGHATFTSSTSGYAPASGGGTINFLRADGTWTAPSATGFQGYAVNNWIQPATGTVAAGTASTANTIYLYPFTVQRSITVSDLGARVTTAGTNLKLAIYGSASGLPTGLPLAGTGSLVGTAATTISSPVTAFNLTAGTLYWGAFNSDAAITMMHLLGSNTYFNNIIGTATLSEIASSATISSWVRSLAGQTFANPWPDLTGVTTTVLTGVGSLRGALIFLKVSAFL